MAQDDAVLNAVFRTERQDCVCDTYSNQILRMPEDRLGNLDRLLVPERLAGLARGMAVS